MTSAHLANRPRRLRAARVATRNALSSMLRLARPVALESLAQQWAAGAQALLRSGVDAPAPHLAPVYLRDVR